MSARNKQRTYFDNAYLGNSKLIAPDALPTPAGTISVEHYAQPIMRTRFKLAGQTLSMAAASDFGALQIVDNLPVKNRLIIGALFNLAWTMAGFTSDVATTVDVALGTVTTASVDFSNAGEDSLIEKVDGVGAGASGTAKGHFFDLASPAVIFQDAGANNDIFLNASSPVATGTGVITFTAGSIVELFHIDLDEPV